MNVIETEISRQFTKDYVPTGKWQLIFEFAYSKRILDLRTDGIIAILHGITHHMTMDELVSLQTYLALKIEEKK